MAETVTKVLLQIHTWLWVIWRESLFCIFDCCSVIEFAMLCAALMLLVPGFFYLGMEESGLNCTGHSWIQQLIPTDCTDHIFYWNKQLQQCVLLGPRWIWFSILTWFLWICCCNSSSQTGFLEKFRDSDNPVWHDGYVKWTSLGIALCFFKWNLYRNVRNIINPSPKNGSSSVWGNILCLHVYSEEAQYGHG